MVEVPYGHYFSSAFNAGLGKLKMAHFKDFRASYNCSRLCTMIGQEGPKVAAALNDIKEKHLDKETKKVSDEKAFQAEIDIFVTEKVRIERHKIQMGDVDWSRTTMLTPEEINVLEPIIEFSEESAQNEQKKPGLKAV